MISIQAACTSAGEIERLLASGGGPGKSRCKLQEFLEMDESHESITVRIKSSELHFLSCNLQEVLEMDESHESITVRVIRVMLSFDVSNGRRTPVRHQTLSL